VCAQPDDAQPYDAQPHNAQPYDAKPDDPISDDAQPDDAKPDDSIAHVRHGRRTVHVHTRTATHAHNTMWPSWLSWGVRGPHSATLVLEGFRRAMCEQGRLVQDCDTQHGDAEHIHTDDAQPYNAYPDNAEPYDPISDDA
jgi:hypothetical protein